MARARDQFRQQDVTFWGIVALSCGALGLLSANISALLPDSAFAALHATRLGGASASEVHSALDALIDRQARLETAGNQLSARLDGDERTAGSVVRRVSALEDSVPKLTEALNMRQTVPIDPAIVTGAIGTPQQGFSKEPVAPIRADAQQSDAATSPVPLTGSQATAAGSQPMPAAIASNRDQSGDLRVSSAASTDGAAGPTSAVPAWVAPRTAQPYSGQPSPATQPTSRQTASAAPVAGVNGRSAGGAPARPDVIAAGAIPETPSAAPATDAAGEATAVASAKMAARPDVHAIGVAIGTPVDPSKALSAWQELAARVGLLLVGTSPLLADDPAGSPGKVLVAGPLPDIAAATKLCRSIDGAGIACMPMPYVGSPLSPAAGAAPSSRTSTAPPQ